MAKKGGKRGLRRSRWRQKTLIFCYTKYQKMSRAYECLNSALLKRYKVLFALSIYQHFHFHILFECCKYAKTFRITREKKFVWRQNTRKVQTFQIITKNLLGKKFKQRTQWSIKLIQVSFLPNFFRSENENVSLLSLSICSIKKYCLY